MTNDRTGWMVITRRGVSIHIALLQLARFIIAAGFGSAGVATFYEKSLGVALYPALDATSYGTYVVAAFEVLGAVIILVSAELVRIGAVILFWIMVLKGVHEYERSLAVPVAAPIVAAILIYVAYQFAMGATRDITFGRLNPGPRGAFDNPCSRIPLENN